MCRIIFGYQYEQDKEIESSKYTILKNKNKKYIGIEIINTLEYSELIKIVILKSDNLRKDLEEKNNPTLYILD